MANLSQSILIGVDLGGTNLRAAAITAVGNLLHSRAMPIEAAHGPEAGVQKLCALIEAVCAHVGSPIAAIGIGSTGPLDRERGCIQNPYTLPGWEDVDIVSPLRQRFGVPVALENDADAAALGEAWTGAGRGQPRLAMVTIGTGVGYALVLDGQIYRGLRGGHPEGGHFIIDPAGPECYCGGRGCWESLVSGPAIARQARQSPGLHASVLYAECAGRIESIQAADVFSAARRGDPLASSIVTEVADWIALGLVNILMLTLPDCILLTGGVLRSYDMMETHIQKVIARHDVIIPARKVEIRLAALGQQSGIFGAERAAQIELSTG